MDPLVESVQLREALLRLMREKGSRVLSISEITERLGLIEGRAIDRSTVNSLVESLEGAGELVTVRGKRYSLPEFTSYVSGRVKVHPDGHGTIWKSREEPEVYLDRKQLRGAMNGDLVMARVDKRTHNVRTFHGRTYMDGEVQRVLVRENRTVVGRFHGGNDPYVKPFDTRLDTDIEIDPGATMNAREGEMVNVEIDRFPDKQALAFGRVVETLGFIGEPGVDIEVVIRKYKIPHRFAEEVEGQAEEIPHTIDEAEIARRVDLRDRTIVTIDGETAKDFDDAVEVERLPNGNYKLGVHIADVAHYVTEGSPLDLEAYERGTSVYFPGRAVPMLPERLSNGICSLNPQVDRLTFSAVIEIDPRGRFVEKEIFKSVIRTRERMTYTDVNLLLTEPTPELELRYAALLDEFAKMRELFDVLRKRREARGSIDFDLPEAEVVLTGAGEIEAIRPSERNIAHRIIEEFMLSANEVVAQHLVFSAQPGLYRVHHPPDAQRIEDLKAILKEFKHKLRANPEAIKPGELQKVLTDVEGTPEERFLTELVLRSMKRALYSEECEGHFALALQNYAHFTSPIRRYPDLIVHRRLAELVADGPAYGVKLEGLNARHPQIAVQASERERRADDAEREVLEWKKVIFMRDKLGLEVEGTITGVVPFGLFVELREFFVQGLVPVSTIGGDFWVFAEREHRLRGERNNREFRLGDRVMVRVEAINEDKRQIEFRLLSAGGEAIVERSRSDVNQRRR